ncbi:MAG TPA: DUF3379 family protein [Rudaea sp.]|nr:DUF3379 family protein [Rudaea sp.]
MNCLEFRRQLNTDPHVSGDFAQHRVECARCAEAFARANAFEKSLRGALEIDVPANLAESILLAQATNEQRARRPSRRRAMWISMAATAVLVAGIGVYAQAKPLPELAVTHVKKEAFLLGKTQPITDESIRKAFARFGVTMSGIPTGSSFVACCPIGRYVSVHLVVPESEGPVTVLYLVDDQREQRQDFIREGFHGRSVPLAHGTLVLLGHDAAHFDELETAWTSALQSATFKA